MILCVTLNPCLDKTLTVPVWMPGDSVRGRSLREVVGGKGNNVARALTKLGRAARPVTFLGGAVGARCEELLRSEDGLDPIVVRSSAPTREILTVRTEHTAQQTAFFDPDPAVSAEEVEALVARVTEALDAGGVEALTLSGSSPSPPAHGAYSDLIAAAKARRVPVFLDTYGPALEAIWGFWPDAIQVNLREAAAHLGLPTKGHPSVSDVRELLSRWRRRGVEVAAVTDGPNPFLARVGGALYRVTPPEIDAVNPIGSGDAFLAGLVEGRLANLGPEALLRFAAGCAAANASTWDAGAIDREAAERFADDVGLELLAG